LPQFIEYLYIKGFMRFASMSPDLFTQTAVETTIQMQFSCSRLLDHPAQIAAGRFTRPTSHGAWEPSWRVPSTFRKSRREDYRMMPELLLSVALVL
jgi:hypothetical protein